MHVYSEIGKIWNKKVKESVEQKKPFKAPKNIMILGAPGLGKSAMTAELAKDLGIGFIDVRLAQEEPTSIQGVRCPDYEKQETILFKSELFNLPEDWVGIIFFDELPAAPKINQLSAYQILQERVVGKTKLPDGAWLIASGNREEDYAIANPIPSTIMTRFIQFELLPTTETINNWISWAIGSGTVHTSVTALIAKNNELFFDKPKSESKSFACPRTWENFSELIDVVDDAASSQAGVLMLGDKVFSMYSVLHKLADKLKKPEEYLLGTAEFPKPSSEEFYLAVHNIATYLYNNHSKKEMFAGFHNNILSKFDAKFAEDKGENNSMNREMKEAIVMLITTVMNTLYKNKLTHKLQLNDIISLAKKYKISSILAANGAN